MSLSPFPPHYPSTGQRRGRWGRGNDIFICSFKGSLLSPFKPFSFSISPSLWLLLFSPATTIDSNRSFYSLSLLVPFLSTSSLALSLSLFCSIIARLINYKGNSKSEKRSWHFRLQRERNLHTHTYACTDTKRPNHRFLPLHYLSERIFVSLNATHIQKLTAAHTQFT